MRKIKPPKPETGAYILDNVVTASEAARMWCRDRTTILYAINRGYITARKIGRDWLIAYPSLVSHYGKPLRARSPC